MIDKIRLENFKSHADTELELGSQTFLVGPNGCGKTSVLTAIRSACLLGEDSFEHVFKEGTSPDVVCRRGADGFALTLSGHNDEPWSMALRVPVRSEPADGDEELRSREPVVDCKVGEQSFAVNPWKLPRGYRGQRTLFDTPLPREIADEISSAVFLKFDARRLSAPSYSDREQPQVEYDGSGLASVIAHLKLAEEEGFEQLTEALRRVVPAVRKIRIHRVAVRENIRYRERVDDEWRVVRDTQKQIGDEIMFDFVGADKIPAHAASEGTLMALGLLTVLYSPSRPKIILLDDIEQGLHPRAQQELVAVIDEVIHEYPGLQIVATSHSPYLLDEVPPEDVRVMALRKDGSTACRRLTEHPDAKKAMEILSSGEFLSAEGEDWVTGEQES